MKKIVFIIMCCISFQMQGMFRFFWSDYSAQTIAQTSALQQRAEGLLLKNPNNIMLKSYLDTLQTSTIADNCDERKKNLQTLLFPCNTNIFERFTVSCQQDMPEQAQSWLRPWQWYKKPLQMCANIGKEIGSTIQDTKDSLRFSDGVVMTGGLVVADSLVRRNGDNILLSLLASPLYLAVPLTALWIKKSGWDLYPVNHASLVALQQRNMNMQEQNINLQDEVGTLNQNLQTTQSALQDVQASERRLQRYVANATRLRRDQSHQLQREQQFNQNLQNQNNQLRHQQLQDALRNEFSRREYRGQLESIEQNRMQLQQQNVQLQRALQTSEQVRREEKERFMQSLLNSENMAQRVRDLTSDSFESNVGINQNAEQEKAVCRVNSGVVIPRSLKQKVDATTPKEQSLSQSIITSTGEQNHRTTGLNQVNMNNVYPNGQTSSFSGSRPWLSPSSHVATSSVTGSAVSVIVVEGITPGLVKVARYLPK